MNNVIAIITARGGSKRIPNKNFLWKAYFGIFHTGCSGLIPDFLR